MPTLKGKKGIGAYLRERIGQVVHNSELYEASGRQSEYTRRIRELRAAGWQIESHHDATDLRQDEYRLAAEPPDETRPVRFGRGISARLRAEILQRNGYTCQMCGAGPGDVVMGRKVRLEIDHIVQRHNEGDNEPTNLRALCNICNGGGQERLPVPLKRRQVLSTVRRASVEDQRAVLEWLQQRLGE